MDFTRPLACIQLSCLLALLGACSSQAPTPAQPNSIEQIHRQALVLDAHADIEIPGKESRYAGADGRSQVAPDKMAAGGVDAVVMAVAVGPGPRTIEAYQEARRRALEELGAIQQMTADPANNLVLATTANEVIAAHQSGQQAIILGFQNARILAGNLTDLDVFYSAGVRVFALTHMGHNQFADSSRPIYIAELGRHEPEAEHGGLSKLGVAAIARINQLGGIVDISQLSKQAAMQAIALSENPVIASHSNAREICNVSRNLSDEELDAIKANGGVVHVAPFRGYLYDTRDEKLDLQIRAARRAAGIEEDYYYPFELYWEIEDPAQQQAFLSSVSDLLGPGSLDDLVDHIDYIVQRIGINHVGIGTDFNHGSGLEGFADASEAMNVTAKLVERGYTAEQINKIWGGNFLRVFAAAQNRY